MRVGNSITTSWRTRLSRSATRWLLWWSISLKPELFILFSCSFNFPAVCYLRWDCVLSRTISYFMFFYCRSQVWCLWKRLELWVNQCSEMLPPLRKLSYVLLSFCPSCPQWKASLSMCTRSAGSAQLQKFTVGWNLAGQSWGRKSNLKVILVLKMKSSAGFCSLLCSN